MSSGPNIAAFPDGNELHLTAHHEWCAQGAVALQPITVRGKNAKDRFFWLASSRR
jgi:hypothetical protein